jgi:hypothetical protein
LLFSPTCSSFFFFLLVKLAHDYHHHRLVRVIGSCERVCWCYCNWSLGENACEYCLSYIHTYTHTYIYTHTYRQKKRNRQEREIFIDWRLVCVEHVQ